MPIPKKKDRLYWQERFMILEEAENRNAMDYYFNLEKQYDKAIANTQKEMDAWFMRYANNEGITMAEAQKALTDPQLKAFKMDIEEYIEKGKTLRYSDEWAKELEKASIKFHVTKLEALQVQMQQQIESVYGYELDNIDDFIASQYKFGYYHTAFEVQKGLGVGVDLFRLDDNKIKKLISQPWTADARTFSDNIWDNKKKLLKEVDDVLTQGIISGRGYNKMAESLTAKMNTEYYKAKRIIVTESAFFSSQGQKDCFNDLGVKKYEFIATLDFKTSDLCKSFDGKVIDMKYFKPGSTAPPLHANCRSCTCPVFQDEFETGTMRAARDENGKTIMVPSDMKYGDWEKKFVKKG
jgi:SPP1 gp7 family putative phage head morphogenesis protein